MGENSIISTDGGALEVDKRDLVGKAERTVSQKRPFVLCWHGEPKQHETQNISH